MLWRPEFSVCDSPGAQCFPNESLAKRAVWANAPRHNGCNAVDSEAAQERNGPMTKNELIAAVAGKAQMTKTAAATAVEATFDAITSTLKRGAGAPASKRAPGVTVTAMTKSPGPT